MDERVRAVLSSLEPTSAEYYNIGPESGRMFHLLARLMGARTILEVGTSNGYSTIWFADAARECGGRVISLESHPGRLAEARENLERAGLAEWVDLRLGDARQLIREVPGPLDILFLDAEKHDYIHYADCALPALRRGGLLIGDDTVKLRDYLEDFIAYLGRHSGLDSFLVPLNDGFSLSVKL